MQQPNDLSSTMPTKDRGEGPQRVVFDSKTCTGCRHLLTKWWKDCLENDETDYGTTARCAMMPDEYGGKCITHYWHDNRATPEWCPLAAEQASS